MNGKNRFYLVIAFLCSVSGIQAQKSHHNIMLGFSVGYDNYFGATNKPEQVREYKSAYDNYYYGCGVISPDQSVDIFHAGVQAEYFLCNNRIGLSSGLRFSHTSAKLQSDEEYFFWKIGEENLITDYVRIRKITEQNYWLGIPFEIRFLTKKRNIRKHDYQCYLKLGYSYNRLIGSNNGISFQNQAMEGYASEIQEHLLPLSSAYSYFYPAFGLKIGRVKDHQDRFPQINLECHVPGALLSKNISSFLKPNGNIGAGIQLTVQIPLGTNTSSKHK